MPPATGTQVAEATSDDFEELVLESPTPVVVDFWAPWCVWCKKLAPVYDSLSTTMSSTLKFVKVNVEEHPELSERYGISGLPTLKFFCEGREIGEIVGAAPKERLEAEFHRIVKGHKDCLASSSPVKA